MIDAKIKAVKTGQLCSVPFTSLVLEADGTISVCRMKGGNKPVGHIEKTSILEAWNGPEIKKWRQDFLSSEFKICSDELCHRKCNQSAVTDEILSLTDFSIEQSGPPLRLGLNLNGQCNLTCPMCSVWTKPSGFYNNPKYRKMIEEIIPHIKEVEFLSGEPFIQKDTYEYIDLISATNPDCLWNITTNTQWQLNDFIKNKLNKIKFRKLIISLDSLNEATFAKIRKGGTLQRSLDTIRDLIKYNASRQALGLDDLKMDLNCSIQKNNWREIPKLLEFGRTHNFYTGITFVYSPSNLSLLSYSHDEREKILAELITLLSPDDLQLSMLVIRPLLKSLSPISKAQAIDRLSFKLSKSPLT